MHLADNYNPLKANKRAIVLFQQETSQIQRQRRLLLPRDWLPTDAGLRLRTTAWGLSGSEVGAGITSITRLLRTLREIIR